ncbi:unnamed protein product [Closterium sp. NIES-54]
MLGEGGQRSFMVVYVDDILIFSPSSDLVKEVMLKLQDKFKCKALGDVTFYLGLHIERDVEKRCMQVHQRKYLEALAANFGQSEGHVATPFPSGFKCVKGPEEESVGEDERRRFHSLVGSLIYAAVNTRSDVAFATGQLARVVQCPNEEQVAAGMRVAKYLGQTVTVGLQFSAAAQRRQKGADGVEPGRLFLTAFSNASYASEPEDMTSVGGFICCVGGGPTSWESKKQVDQALSSVESEYMALFRAFDTWLDDLQLYLLSESRDSVSLFDHTSRASPAPPATADSATRSQWLTRDAAACLAIRNHLPLAECAHFGQHRTAQALYNAVVARYSSPAIAALGRLLLPYMFPELSAFATVEDLITHLRTSDARYYAAQPAEFLDRNPPSMYITLYFIVTRLPDSLRAVRDHFLALDPTALTLDLLEQDLLAAKTNIVAVGAARGTPRMPFFEGFSPSPIAPSYASAAAVDVLGAEDVGAASAGGKRRSSKGKGGRGGDGGNGGGGGGTSGDRGGSEGGGGGGSGGGSGGFDDRIGGSGGGVGSGGNGSGGNRAGAVLRGGSGGGQRQQQQRQSETPSPQQLRPLSVGHLGICGKPHTQHRCFSRLDDAWRTEFGDEAERPRWSELLRSGVDIFALDYNAILAAMYALSVSVEGGCYLCVLPDLGIEAAALIASESILPRTAPAEALHTFMLDPGASRYFFRDSTTLTPLSSPVPVRLADPSGGPILARSSTVLPCPVVPSGSLSGLHPPSFSTKLVSTAAFQDSMVTTTTLGGQRVSICTCTWTGHHLATFACRPGSSLYTLTAEPSQVAASAHVSAPLCGTTDLVTPPCHFFVACTPRPEPLSPQQLREWFAQRTRLRSGAAGAGDSAAGDTGAGGVGATRLGGAEVTAGAGGTGGAAAVGPGGARTRGTGAAGTGSVGGTCAGGAGGGDPAEPRGAGAGAAGAGGTGAGGTGAGGAGARDTGAIGAGAGGTGAGGVGARGAGTGDTGAVDPRAGGAGDGGAVSGGTGAGGTVRPRLFFVPLLRQVFSLLSSTGLPPGLLRPPPRPSQPQLQPSSALPAPSPYAENIDSFTERREPQSRPASPVHDVRTGRRVPSLRSPPVPGTHAMALRPSSVPLCVPLPPPLESSLPTVPDPASDLAHAASPTVSCLFATVVTNPSFESTAASVLVSELIDFAAASRLDYTTALVAESESACPPSVGGEGALGTDVLEDRQEDLECLAVVVPHLVAIMLAPEGDPDAPDIPTPRSYAEAIMGPCSS